MKHFLVICDPNETPLEAIEFEDLEAAQAEKHRRRTAGHEGDLVLCFAKDLKSLFRAYLEYRIRANPQSPA